MSSSTATTIVLAFLAATSVVGLRASRENLEIGQGQRVRWYVVDDQLNLKGQSLTLGDTEQIVRLKAGWNCTVGATSKQLPAYEARTTVCQKASDAFQFVVQCERSRPTDHTQIAFLNADRKPSGFVEVGCELF